MAHKKKLAVQPNKKIEFKLRIHEAFHVELKAHAAADLRSLNAYIEYVLLQHIAAHPLPNTEKVA